MGGTLLGWAAQGDSATFAAWLLRRSIRVWGNPRAENRVLCIQRSIFEDDVRAMAERTDEVGFGMLPKGRLDDVFQVFVRRHPDHTRLTEFTYHHDCCAEALAAYGEFMERVLTQLWSAWPFDAVLSGNFGYTQQQEIARIVEKRCLPFITLFKEGLLIPAQLDSLSSEYIDGKRFVGSKIIFYSEQIREAVLKSDAFHGREFEVAVSGIPRLDQLVSAPLPKSRQIVLFSFYPPIKFRCFQAGSATLEAATRAADAFHRMFFRFASENPDWKLVVKTKVGAKFLNYAQQLLEAELGEQPSNVEITNTGEATQMILNSRVIAGFTSTTGIEALVAGRTVICPDFAEYFGDEPWDYFQDDPDLVTYAKSLDDLQRAVDGGQSEGDAAWLARRDAFLQRMVNGADGQACERATREILDSITAGQQTA